MEEEQNLFETLVERAEQYGKTSFELYKLKAIDKIAEVVSSIMARLAVLVFITIFFLIVNIGIALWIGEILNKSYYGFFAVSGFYAVLSVLIYAFRKQWIKDPVSNSIAAHAFK